MRTRSLNRRGGPADGTAQALRQALGIDELPPLAPAADEPVESTEHSAKPSRSGQEREAEELEGAAEEPPMNILELEVSWPASGILQRFPDVAMNQAFQVLEGDFRLIPLVFKKLDLFPDLVVNLQMLPGSGAKV